ncbi:MAG: glycosyltransferase family 4 protein [Leptothrix sp. (in: b-proteobacteria)]
MTKNVLFVHQSADLYGSDKILMSIVCRLADHNYIPIVIIPVDGPLVVELRQAGIECHIMPLAILSRGLMTLRGVLSIPINIYKSVRALDNLLRGRTVDMVHSNTLAVLTGAFWSRKNNIFHVWHVHEIVVHPKIAITIFGYLLKWFSDRIICVSDAARLGIAKVQPELQYRCRVVYNGLYRDIDPNHSLVNSRPAFITKKPGDVVLVLVGRINRLKGQTLLVEAINILWARNINNINVTFVGGVVPGQEYFIKKLQEFIEESPAREKISIQPFIRNIWPVWDGCDIAVVPSTEPESFGLVAIEAMAAGKPVVAAAHGGLTEIVIPGQTGWLVPPCNALALADALQEAISQPELRRRMGQAGRVRYQAEFTLDRQIQQIAAVYDELLQ